MWKPIKPPYPKYISIEPTSRCNLRCAMCPREVLEPRRRNHDLTWEDFRRIVDSFPTPTTITVCGIAEPLMHERACDMLDYIDARGAKPVLITNGTLIDESMARRIFRTKVAKITVSFHALSPQLSPGSTKAAAFERMIGVLRLMVHARREEGSGAYLMVNLVIMNNNADRIPDAAARVAATGVDQVVGLRLLTVNGAVENIKATREQVEQLIRFKKSKIARDMKFEFWDSGGGFCDELWTSCFVHANGDVFPCDGYLYDKPPMGNLLRQTLDEIWHNCPYRDLRLEKITGRMEACRYCAKGGAIASRVQMLGERLSNAIQHLR